MFFINKGPPGPPGYTRPGPPGKHLFPPPKIYL